MKLTTHLGCASSTIYWTPALCQAPQIHRWTWQDWPWCSGRGGQQEGLQMHDMEMRMHRRLWCGQEEQVGSLWGRQVQRGPGTWAVETATALQGAAGPHWAQGGPRHRQTCLWVLTRFASPSALAELWGGAMLRERQCGYQATPKRCK
jgi:hypothetical protein